MKEHKNNGRAYLLVDSRGVKEWGVRYEPPFTQLYAVCLGMNIAHRKISEQWGIVGHAKDLTESQAAEIVGEYLPGLWVDYTRPASSVMCLTTAIESLRSLIESHNLDFTRTLILQRIG